MIFTFYALALVALAALPTALVLRNLRLFQTATQAVPREERPVSVLIPARNEESAIADAVQSIVNGGWRRLEVIVMDDHSTDRTASIVAGLAASEPRLKLARAPELPAGWNGKQHACWQLARLAQSDLLLFMDADVRLEPDAIQRYVSEYEHRCADLLSGFPQQELGSLGERMLIPLMYVVLLGYLPLDQMRASCKPQFGAGCGQLFLATRDAYFSCQGHQKIASSRHDGLQLPRSFRSAGLRTDLFDASDIARVRMYRGWREVVPGLLKNATEGIAHPKLIVLFSILLLGGFTLPVFSFAHALFHGWPRLATLLLGVATGLSFVPRALLAHRLRHSLLDVALHPLAVLLLVALQWFAFLRQLFGGGPVAWRGRS